MKLSLDEFRKWNNKCVTLLGMSGVGKTRLANMLRHKNWFHYSGDYRIGTRYLDEPILDNIKQQIMHIPFMRDLLRSDSIYICSNITVHNLDPLSTFLGKIGDQVKIVASKPISREKHWVVESIIKREIRTEDAGIDAAAAVDLDEDNGE